MEDRTARPRLALSLFAAQDLAGGDPGFLVEVAAAADAAGIDQVNVTDHVIMGERTDRYPFGAFPVAPSYPWFEPLALLGVIAGSTARIRLSTGILIAPLRPAVLLAKQVATLDVLSLGRIDLGLGVGWQPEEYDATGVPFDERWSRLDDTVRTMRRLWEVGGPTSLDERSVAFADLSSFPCPAQARMPVWFGVAATPRQARRVAELGDGWIPIGRDPQEIAPGIALMRSAFDQAGRDPADLVVRAKTVVSGGRDTAEAWDRTCEQALASARVGVDVLDFALVEHVTDRSRVRAFLEHVVRWRDRLSAGER